MIYILTVYDSLNYGSYLQAISLQHELEQYGEVSFLDIDHQSTLKQCLKKVAGHIARRRFGGIGFEFKKWKMYKNNSKRLPITHMKKVAGSDDDIYVFGSDEIWNIDRRKFLNSPEFWGIGLESGKYISYAPSINTASIEQYSQHNELIDAIKSFDSVSVRDKYSRSILRELTGRNIDVVLDPTFLFGADNFRKLEKKTSESKPYIMLYTYGKMCRTQEQIDCIKAAAKEKGCKLISVGKYFKWADKSVNATPEEFLGYISNAEYILTDTFHGTVFSILYRKNFAEVNPAKKIVDLLNGFELNSCVISDVSQLKNIIGNKTDYSKADLIQKKLTESSKAFLRNAINE